MIFLCVGTPQREDGAADVSQIEALARAVGKNLNGYKLVVEKSTVPAVTARWVKRTIGRYASKKGENGERTNGDGEIALSSRESSGADFDVASNPEFLREGKAMDDFFRPNRVVLGVDSDRARAILEEIYRPIQCPKVVTDLATAELIKHAANSFLSTKISFINMVADICDSVGADVVKVAEGLGLDPRIAPGFLQAGVGFGGFCFPKDLRAFVRLAEDRGIDCSLLRDVERINHQRVDVFLRKIRSFLWVLQDKPIGVLGLAFKPDTDDIREAPSLKIIDALLKEGADLRLYDPWAMPAVQQLYPPLAGDITYCDSPYEVARGAEALLLLTEWPEFKRLDLERLHGLMGRPSSLTDVISSNLRKCRKRGLPTSAWAGQVANLFIGKRPTHHPSGPWYAGKPRWWEDCMANVLQAKSAAPRTLVTGGAGFLGSHLCDRLIAEGHEVLCVDTLLTGRMTNIQHLLDHPRFAFVLHDVTEPMDLADLTRRAENGLNRGKKSDVRLDYILNFASPASPKAYAEHPIHTLKLGSLGTFHALGMAKKYGAVFLMASTSEVYGDPEITPQTEVYWGHVNPIGPRSVYDEAKRFAEAIIMAYSREHGVKVRIARIFNTYGERMRIDDGRALPNFLSQALQNQPLTVYGNGAQTRSFCYVGDLVEGLFRLLTSDQTGPINLGNPEEIALLRLAERVIERTNSESKIVFEPLPVNDPARRRPDISKATTILNWRPRVSLREGIDRVIPYFKSQIEGMPATLLTAGQAVAG